MLDLKVELNETNIPFEPIGWVKAPAYPYGIFDDVVDVRGTDLPSPVRILTHAVTITAFHKEYDQILLVRDRLAAWATARALTCRMRVQYVDDDDHYAVVLTPNITETERNDQ